MCLQQTQPTLGYMDTSSSEEDSDLPSNPNNEINHKKLTGVMVYTADPTTPQKETTTSSANSESKMPKSNNNTLDPLKLSGGTLTSVALTGVTLPCTQTHPEGSGDIDETTHNSCEITTNQSAGSNTNVELSGGTSYQTRSPPEKGVGPNTDAILSGGTSHPVRSATDNAESSFENN